MVSGTIGSILNMIIGMVIGIMLSIIFFVLTLFIINVSADIVFPDSLNANWGVLAAALLTVGSMLGGTGMRKGAV